MKNKLLYYFVQLKEWAKNPTSSFCPSKSFKIHFRKVYSSLTREEYIIEITEDGVTTRIPSSVVDKGDVRYAYIDLMTELIYDSIPSVATA